MFAWALTVIMGFLALAYFGMGAGLFCRYLVEEVLLVIPVVLAVFPNALRRTWREMVRLLEEE
jgi:hypothetical protein